MKSARLTFGFSTEEKATAFLARLEGSAAKVKRFSSAAEALRVAASHGAQVVLDYEEDEAGHATGTLLRPMEMPEESPWGAD